jgi:hypothetical protein
VSDLRAYMAPLLANQGASGLPAPSGYTWAWDEDAGDSGGEEGEEWVFGGQQAEEEGLVGEGQQEWLLAPAGAE